MLPRVVLIGCVESSEAALGALLRGNNCRLVGVVSRSRSEENADFVNLSGEARRCGVDCLLLKDPKRSEVLAEWLRDRSPDLLFCVGWSWLLPREVLLIPKHGAFGYHPAAVPMNRGRHPIIWAVALGLTETASTFFVMGENPDSGAVVDQVPIQIGADDTAREVYDKIIEAIGTQVPRIIDRFSHGKLVPVEQDLSKGNVWRKRSPSDGVIDWRMPAEGVHNLVRALAPPYRGATVGMGRQSVKVVSTEVVSRAPANAEPGKVLAVNGRSIVVKCGVGAIRLLDHDMLTLPKVGGYL